MNKPKATPAIDTANNQLVGVNGDNLVILRWQRQLSISDALNLAAWIVAMCNSDDEFLELLKALRDA